MLSTTPIDTHSPPPPHNTIHLSPQTPYSFPKEAINDETVELLAPYFAAPDFTYESASKASGNVAGVCVCVRAHCGGVWFVFVGAGGGGVAAGVAGVWTRRRRRAVAVRGRP